MAQQQKTEETLETTLHEVGEYFKLWKGSEVALYLEQLDDLEKLIEREEYDFEQIRDDEEIRQELRADFLRTQQPFSIAHEVIDKMESLIAGDDGLAVSSLSGRYQYKTHYQMTSDLIQNPKFSRFNLFETTVDLRTPHQSILKSLDAVIGRKYLSLRRLEAISAVNRMSISEYLVTAYHSSRKPLHEFCALCPLMAECRESGNDAIAELMQRYLVHFEQSVVRPLPIRSDTISIVDDSDDDEDEENEDENEYKINHEDDDNKDDDDEDKECHRYTDDFNTVLLYISEINGALHRILRRQMFPLQIDVFFVAPNCYKHLNLHNLGDFFQRNATSIPTTRAAIDGTSDIYRLLRRVSNEINRRNGRRFIILIVRGNKTDAENDTVYFYRSTQSHDIGSSAISDHIELSYLLNSKSPIVEGLPSNAQGVLGLCHHFHAADCGKVYLSYGDRKSRVFKHEFLERLRSVFNCSKTIYLSPDFKDWKDGDLYIDFEDDRYNDIGRYWFDVDRRYQCWTPLWNTSNCRASHNVFIPNKITRRILQSVDERFESTEHVFYRLDYTLGMAIIDGETVNFVTPKNQKRNEEGVTLIHLDLHQNKEAVYGVLVENNRHYTQKWEMETFMTRTEVLIKYQFFERDLPRGSRAKHRDFIDKLSPIQVTEAVILKTKWAQIPVLPKDEGRHEVLEMNEKSFRRSVLRSWRHMKATKSGLVPSVTVKCRKGTYRLEKLLRVSLGVGNGKVAGFVAVAFGCDPPRGTRVMAVYWDWTDIRNKTSLIDGLPSEWRLGDDMCSRKVIICNHRKL